MTICTPGFFGLIVRKNDRTRQFIEKKIAFLLKHFPGANRESLNEDPHLIGLSVAMNGADLQFSIDSLVECGAARGEDFVVTSSFEGVLDPLPNWLALAAVPAEHAATAGESKWYSFVNERNSDA